MAISTFSKQAAMDKAEAKHPSELDTNVEKFSIEKDPYNKNKDARHLGFIQREKEWNEKFPGNSFQENFDKKWGSASIEDLRNELKNRGIYANTHIWEMDPYYEDNIKEFQSKYPGAPEKDYTEWFGDEDLYGDEETHYVRLNKHNPEHRETELLQRLLKKKISDEHKDAMKLYGVED